MTKREENPQKNKKRIKMNKKYNFSIGVMFKDEAHIMEEWIQHYLRIGVDRIYMINHQSGDSYMDILTKYVNEKVLTLYHSDHKPKRLAQIKQYNEKITPHVKDSQWFAFLDMDEFLYSRKNNNIIDILNNSEYNSYSVPWINFGSNGLLDTPKSAVKSFTSRADYNNPNNVYIALRQFKTVFNTDTFNKVVELHSVGGQKNRMHKRHEIVKLSQLKTLNEDHVKQMDLAINHYSVQSKNWYEKIKNKKLAGNSGQVKYQSTYWKLMNTNEIEDNTLKNQGI